MAAPEFGLGWGLKCEGRLAPQSWKFKIRRPNHLADGIARRNKPSMLRHAFFVAKLALLIAVSPLHALQVNAQTAGNPTVPEPVVRNSSRVEPDEQVCVTIRHVRERITLGRGRAKIEITLGGGACEPPGSGISDLVAGRSRSVDAMDVVEASNCPAFQKQIDSLWARRQHYRPVYRGAGTVSVGALTFQGTSGLFELRSNRGRLAAAQWLRQTLTLVEPCWNTIRDDRTRHVVPGLYRMLGIKHW